MAAVDIILNFKAHTRIANGPGSQKATSTESSK